MADSAITIEGGRVGLDAQPTSFGELSYSSNERLVIEAGVKVVRVSTDCVVGIAGLIEPAMNALRILRYRLLSRASVPECLDAIKDRTVEGFQLLVAGHEHAAPRLWQVADGRINERFVPGTVMVLGSADQEHKVWLAERIAGAYSGGPRNMLAAAIVAAQVRGQNRNAMADGVGGAFYGAFVADSRVELSPDVLFTFVSSPIVAMWDHMRAVLSGWRDGIAYVRTLEKHANGQLGHSARWRWFPSGVPYIDSDAVDALQKRVMSERSQPEYVALVDEVTSSYVLTITRVRTDLVTAVVGEDAVDLNVKGIVLQIAEALFEEAKRRQEIGFCHVDDAFPPRDLKPDSVFRFLKDSPGEP